MGNEIRHDSLLDRYVIVASERSKRPTDFAVPPIADVGGVCPFCPGSEEATPPADLILLKREGKVFLSMDDNGARTKDWQVRCFPNLYPALSPSTQQMSSRDSPMPLRSAYGHHEVVVESPNHHDHPGQAKPEQTQLALKASLTLLQRYYEDKKTKYVELFRNHRKEGGASLSHPHSQIIATPFIPPKIKSELTAARRHFMTRKRCIFCEIVEKERSSPRRVFENDHFLVFSPWASISPFEFWVTPKRHEPRLENLPEEEQKDLVEALNISLGALARLLHDPPYNYGFHTSPNGMESEFYHWHLEVYPKLSILAGFELSTGAYINVTPPELAANALREMVVNR